MIEIFKGDSTIFADSKKFITFNINTGLEINNWQAIFTLGSIKRVIKGLKEKTFDVIIDSFESASLPLGVNYGTLRLVDDQGHIKTLANDIPFNVTDKVICAQHGTVTVDLSECPSTVIEVGVGGGAVTSVNGKDGDVVLTLDDLAGDISYTRLIDKPKINNKEIVGEISLEDINAQPSGDYALTNDLNNKLEANNIIQGENITLSKDGNNITINAISGSSGTSDYNDLTNKPTINNVELIGNKNLVDLGIQPSGDYAEKSELTPLATKEEVKLKADKSELEKLAVKSDVEKSLNLKADKTELTSLATKDEVNLKADKTELNNYATKGELNNKADKTALNTKIDKNQGSQNNGKFLGIGPDGNVIPKEVQGGLSEISWGDITGILSNQTDLQEALNAKAITTDVNKALDLKADKTELAPLATKKEVELKADKTELEKLAVKSEVEASLDLKADKSQLTPLATKEEVKLKADKTELANYATKKELGDKADKSELNTKIDKNQGSQNNGKFLGIGPDGNVTPMSAGGGGGANAVWGEIQGNLSNQIDLQEALSLKRDLPQVHTDLSITAPVIENAQGNHTYIYGTIDSLKVNSVENSPLGCTIIFTTNSSTPTINLPTSLDGINISTGFESSKKYVIAIENNIAVMGTVE